MEKCTDTVVDWMIRCNAITEADRELYQYALYSFSLLFSPLLLAGGIGFCFGSIKQGIILIIPFIVLRKFSGGYHAKNLHACILVSGFLLFLCTMLSMYVRCDWKLAIATVIASVSLIVFSPIDSENRRLDTEEKETYKKITFFCVCILVLTNIVLFLFERKSYAIHFSIGIQLAAWLQIPCIIKRNCKLTKNIE
ncbi:MAG: accessory gene regulator B family protein [Eubacteriales bacterium]|nr:accessory gene regulator B family protein [Eubacteriales bacterium]